MLRGDWFVCTTVHLFLHEQMSSVVEQALESGCLGSNLGSVLWEILQFLYQFSLVTHRVDVRLNLACSKCPINIILNIIL